MTTQEIRFLGIDLHTDSFTVRTQTLEGRKHLKTYSILEDMDEFEKTLRKTDIVAVEASTNTFSFVKRIQDKVMKVYIVNPKKFSIIHNTNKKTDKIDSDKLSTGARNHYITNEDYLPVVYMPEDSVIELRSLFTTYKQLQKKRTMSLNRIHSILKSKLYPFNKKNLVTSRAREEIKKLNICESSKFEIELMYEEIDLYNKQIKEVQTKIESYAKEFEDEVRIIISINGVSILTAMAIKTDYADIGRFKNSKHFTSYLRTAPCVDSSNNKTHIKKINKNSRKLALSLILQGLRHYWEGDPHIGIFRIRKLNGKAKGKVRIAIARGLLTRLFIMLKTKELYRNRNIYSYSRKIKELEKIINS